MLLMVLFSIRAWESIYSCLLLYCSTRSLCLYSCILKKESSICFCNDHLANKQLMGFLHRCSCRKKMRRQGPGTCPSGDPVNLQLPLLLSAFPSFKPDVHFPLFLSFFTLLPSFVLPLSFCPRKHCVNRIPEHWHLFFLRLWENSSSCFLRCFSHSSPRFQITRAQWVGRTRSANTAERSDEVWSFSSRERANTKQFFAHMFVFSVQQGCQSDI